VFRLPAYAPDLNLPVLERGMLAILAAASFGHLVQVIRARPEEDPVPARPHRRLPGRNRPVPGPEVRDQDLHVRPTAPSTDFAEFVAGRSAELLRLAMC
jgi:hypothetical protein